MAECFFTQKVLSILSTGVLFYSTVANYGSEFVNLRSTVVHNLAHFWLETRKKFLQVLQLQHSVIHYQQCCFLAWRIFGIFVREKFYRMFRCR